MKRKGKHAHRELTDTKVRQLKIPGRYADGNGLYLVVDRNINKRWILRTVVNRRRRDMGLGSCELVSLRTARQLAATYRAIARDGGDPIAQRRRAKITVPTFAEAALKVHSEGVWKNPKHKQQWINTLKQYVFPFIGELRVDQIEPSDVLKALKPIWTTKPETSRRIKQRISKVLDHAKVEGWRSGENPVNGVQQGLPAQRASISHHKALSYRELPSFMNKLQRSNLTRIAKLALEFLILTAARTTEVLGAHWSEIDFEDKTWTIPASRMKANAEHNVPLSPRAVQVLREAQTLSWNCELVFPGRSAKRLSNMVFLKALRRMNVTATTHGFRSTFRDWAAEKTSTPREVCERALAHTVRNKAEAAYFRSDLFAKRRELMAQWAEFATGRLVETRRVFA
jgi:integrase